VVHSFRLQLTLAFLLSFGVILGQIYKNGPRAPEADELIYVEIAYDLNTFGIYSNGWSETGRALADTPAPGRFFGPAYPFFLAGMSLADPSVKSYLACHAARASDCPDPPVSLITAQALMAAIQMACVFAIALIVSGSSVLAGLALVLALIFGQAAIYAQTFLTENTAFLGFYVFLAAGVAAVSKPSKTIFALAGLGLAIAVLSRPSYIYLFYLVSLILAGLAWRNSNLTGLSWRHAAIFTGVVLAIAAPWMARNIVVFGEPALSAGYGAYILVQRVAYNAMSWPEWAASFIFWLPDFGDNLSRAIFPAELYARLGFENPKDFYVVGNRELRPATLEAAGGAENHLSYLLNVYVLGDLFKHIMVTFPITLRGIWVGKYLALAGILFLPAVGWTLFKRRRFAPFAFMVFALFFMAGLHGFVSVNVVRYNIPMVALYALVAAYVVMDMVRRMGWADPALFARDGSALVASPPAHTFK